MRSRSITLSLISIGMALLAALTWLTVTGFQLARQSEIAQANASQSELVRTALWRLDSKLAPIIASEITKPSSVVCSLATNPPLSNATPYVDTYFYWPKSLELTPESVPQAAISSLLTEIASNTSWDKLYEQLPEQQLPSNAPDQMGNFVRIGANDEPESFIQSDPQQAVANGLNRNTRSNDLSKRSSVYQNSAAGQYNVQSLQNGDQGKSAASRLSAMIDSTTPGVSRCLWLSDDRLILARRSQTRDPSMNNAVDVIEGCSLNWAALREDLLREVSDILPGVVIEPSDMNAEIDNVLAGIPVRLVTPPIHVVHAWTPLTISIVGVWLAAATAFAATSVLLFGLARLSEKRASFVSAVTHELRTPLTTFRMYSEMLAQGMVSADDRKHYLLTLVREADRLNHLIDNVLTFSRLENQANRRPFIQLSVDELLANVSERLVNRASQADMQLQIEIEDDCVGTNVETDPASVEQILFNLVDNAAKYASGTPDAKIQLTAKRNDDGVILSVKDNGPGIDKNVIKRLFRPFSKSVEQAASSKPGVGLGLALAKKLAKQIQGKLLHVTQSQLGCEMHLVLKRSTGTTDRNPLQR